MLASSAGCLSSLSICATSVDRPQAVRYRAKRMDLSSGGVRNLSGWGRHQNKFRTGLGEIKKPPKGLLEPKQQSCALAHRSCTRAAWKARVSRSVRPGRR
jgi:hypothetical protein